MAAVSPMPAGHVQAHAMLQRKVDKLTGIKLTGSTMPLTGPALSDDVSSGSDLVTALSELDSFYQDNTLANRLELRDMIERRTLAAHKEFLGAFKRINQLVAGVEESVNELESQVSAMNNRLQSSLSLTDSLMARAQNIVHLSEENQVAQRVLERFVQRFELTAQESAALTGADPARQQSSLRASDDLSVGVNDSFFDALERLRQINADSRILLKAQHQRAGLEIMDESARLLESTFKSLYRWVKSECAELERDEPRVHARLADAFYSLRDRPVLLSYCLQEVGDIRTRAVKRNFIQALTVGGPNGIPKPMELHAHDPVRFISDMAAWLHQALASESELLYVLLRKLDSSLDKSNEEERKKVNEHRSAVLNCSLSDVCYPFKSRVTQVLSSRSVSLVVACRLRFIFDLYRRNFSTLLGPMSVLVRTFEECKSEASEVFTAMCVKLIEKLELTPPIPASDLSPPHEVHEVSSMLNEICQILDASLVPEADRILEFEPILLSIVQPFVQVCELSASSLEPLKRAVFLLNCLNSLRSRFHGSSYVVKIESLLDDLLAQNTRTLVDRQSELLFSRSLAESLDVFDLWRKSQPSPLPLTSMPGFDESRLSQAVRSFESTLVDLSSVMPLLDRILHVDTRRRIRHDVAITVAQRYSQFYDAINDTERSGFLPTSAASLFRFKPSQVQSIIDA